MKTAKADLSNRVDYLSNIFKSKMPLWKLLRTENFYYLYDSGTNKLLNCDPLTYSLLEKFVSKEFETAVNDFTEENGEDCFLETTSMLTKSINRHNLFGLYEVTNFDLFPNKEELKDSISTMSNMLGLEVTEQCNLRCSYCVHIEENKQARSHGNQVMKEETAFAAIDYLKKNSSKASGVSIVIYGGEPLLNFPVIKKSIEYSKTKFTDQEISFSMTTNGTLITPEISHFLFKNNVSVKISIDGPESIHDRYRKNSRGKGSYQETLKGLKHLYNTYGDQFTDKISLNAVYAPPFSLAQIDKRVKLWDELDWLSYDIAAGISYYSGPRLPGISHREDIELMQWAFEDYIFNKAKKKKPHPFSLSLIEKFLITFSQREIYDELPDKFALNGCCIPGLRRIFVTTNGDFRLCERISISSPVFGNVKDGVDMDVLYSVYIKAYSDMSLKKCKKCWAVNLCDSCFVDGFDDKGMSYEKKAEECKNIKLSTEKKLYCLCKTMEIMPTMLDYFKSIKLK